MKQSCHMTVDPTEREALQIHRKRGEGEEGRTRVKKTLVVKNDHTSSSSPSDHHCHQFSSSPSANKSLV